MSKCHIVGNQMPWLKYYIPVKNFLLFCNEFLYLESSHVKMPHCWKSNAMAQILYTWQEFPIVLQ